jgi:phage tail protein X
MYTTQQGDTWDIIAKRQYGSELLMNKLIEANPDYRKVVIFPAGIKVETPSVEESINDDSSLPPWKRGRDG